MSRTPRLLTRFDDHFYAFDKPAGMAVHPADEPMEDLVSWIKRQRSLPRTLRPGHRLDRYTSGVVLCGAHKKARARIAGWLEGPAIKRYLAVVYGTPPEAEGVMEEPLFDARRKRLLEARTSYRVRSRHGELTLLELQLHTGRKHQLRRHLQALGHPVVGDARYGRNKVHPGGLERLWLHAWQLELPERTITAPWPDELAAALEQQTAG